MRVCHVINCLSVGGTERQLIRLLAARSAAVDATVVTLLERNTLREEVEALGVPVRSARLDSTRPTPAALVRLAGILRDGRPDVVQSWLYYANAASTLARPLSGGRWALAWNVRQTLAATGDEHRSLRLALRLNRWLSPRADVMVSNARRALEDHLRAGFRPRATEVIPNGFDVAAAPHGAAARRAARERLGFPGDAFLVGVVGRADPVKNHAGFLEAFSALPGQEGVAAHAVLIGRGIDADPAVAALLERGDLRDRVHLTGERRDVPDLLPAFDYVATVSFAEAFPNVLAEAMAAAVPVIATDVGECREIVGEAGWIVPPGDAPALTKALGAAMRLGPSERAALGERGRSRVLERFEIASVARRYEALWSGLMSRRAAAHG